MVETSHLIWNSINLLKLSFNANDKKGVSYTLNSKLNIHTYMCVYIFMFCASKS